MATDPAPALIQITRLVQQTLERAARRHGISPTLARLLVALDGAAPTINALGELLDLDKSSTSGLVDRAQRRGLVRRIPSQIDRRAVRVRLTDSGRQLSRQLILAQADGVAALLDSLTAADTQALTDSLTTALAAQPHR